MEELIHFDLEEFIRTVGYIGVFAIIFAESGLLIGFFYGLVEKQLSFGVLRILNGAFRGKEVLVGQSRMTVGTGARCDINLSGYRDVAEVHADIAAKRGEVILRRRESGHPLVVNEEKVEQQVLKFEDAIRIGSAKLYFQAE